MSFTTIFSKLGLCLFLGIMLLFVITVVVLQPLRILLQCGQIKPGLGMFVPCRKLRKVFR